MDAAGRVLDILFRQTSPERVLQNLIQRTYGDNGTFFREKNRFEGEKENLFMDFAETTLNGYSENEQRMLYCQLEQQKNRWEEQTSIPSGFFVPLIQYGQKALKIVGGEPRCKSEATLPWRDIYLRLGQDTIVCPFLAYLDYQSNLTRTDFTWPAILRTDDNELYHMLEKGMAENHNHINGGTQSFQITWCRMMNYPEKIQSELKHFKGGNLYARISRGKKDNSLDMHERLELAALLRSILYRALHRNKFNSSFRAEFQGSITEDDEIIENDCIFSGERAFRKEYFGRFFLKNELYNIIDVLRKGIGTQISYPDASAFCLDYVLDNALIQHCADSHIRVLVGERYFLYQCTRECMKPDGFSSFEQGLFYLYLLLKCNFRSEMIQANGQTGFKNFLNYQDRKDDAWDENPYFWEAARMALNYRLSAVSITSLEGRLVPKASTGKNIEKVRRFDTAKRFADCPLAQSEDPSNYNFDVELDVDKFAHLPYFFVYHFVKIPDDRKLAVGKFREVPCRHQTHRRNLRAAAIGLATALKESTYLRNRVRGIDACANEVGCRPEVFATVFRYISGVQHKWNTRLDTLLPTSPMYISKAYHAGEDFLDISDGLRAIDEAVEFLDLGSGSRIGHALAMGTAPEDHYRLKRYEIVTTKQDRLDDLTWLLYRSKELGVRLDGVLESELQSEAYQLFREIYGKSIDRNGWSCELLDYYHSMKLRCDDPSVYYPLKRVCLPAHSVDEYDLYLIDRNKPQLSEYRNEQNVSGLYYYYHYGVEEGICGQQTITCKVSKAYMKLMRQVQDAMQQFLERKKIVIECNPSSNVLIGTFQRYDHHPIFRFNNRKIGSGVSTGSTQLHVCVNTDDLGVFDTSLEFEYALLSQALLTQVDDSSQPKYNTRDVMEYLNDLREMGNAAIFPENLST